MLNCTVDSSVHIWEFEDADEIILSSGASGTQMTGGFVFEVVEVNSSFIVTIAVATATAALNNTMILCRDGNVGAGLGEQQQSTIFIPG